MGGGVREEEEGYQVLDTQSGCTLNGYRAAWGKEGESSSSGHCTGLAYPPQFACWPSQCPCCRHTSQGGRQPPRGTGLGEGRGGEVCPQHHRSYVITAQITSQLASQNIPTKTNRKIQLRSVVTTISASLSTYSHPRTGHHAVVASVRYLLYYCCVPSPRSWPKHNKA